MNLLTMRDKLRRGIGNPTTGAVPDADLAGYLNAAYTDIGDRYRFHQVRRRCEFYTEVGRESYGLPADASVVMRVRDKTNGTKLEKFGDRNMAERPVSDGALLQGAPRHYSRYRDYLSLDPVPDGVYLIEVFYKLPIASLVNDVDVPILPLTWHEGIVKLARFKYFEEVGDFPKAKAAWDFYEVWLSDKPVEVDEEKFDFDSGVSVPTLEQTLTDRLDFNHAD